MVIFLSAFLLFQVQPIVAKIILPWFGGSAAVWSTCMLFFQVVLLLGYVYAHWLHSKLAPRKQAAIHAAALALSLATLPILPNALWKSTAVGLASLRILGLLAVTVGLPYFLLSSTSPLLQAWYARTHKGAVPYRLFALSNFASMLALVSYPLLVEPHLSSRTQALVWSAAYVGFAVLCAVVAWRNLKLQAAGVAVLPIPEESSEPAPGWGVRLLWLGLAASASILLLAVTTHITEDVAAIPFLWILPLAAYLLSFILCFDAPYYYQRLLFVPLAAACLVAVAWQLAPSDSSLPARTAIALFVGSLFVCSMVCHGELARLKPHPRHLTGFYVTVALGGALGGIFVGLVAPNVFNFEYEFPLGLGLAATVWFLVFLREFWKPSTLVARAGMAAAAVLLCGYFVYLGSNVREMVSGYRVVARNFYGQLRVSQEGDPAIDLDACRKLLHGVVNHGEQMLRPEYRYRPITYFCPDSGIGRAMRALEGAPRRIGILGLGCGTLAAYGKAGDTLRIYEINPLVLDIARSEFTYLRDTPARVELALGDGRLLLESEPSQRFDLLVMDAFSGDSVPVHLITREALATYFRHLKPNGILAVNISNRYLNLEPVMAAGAAAFRKQAVVYEFDPPAADFLCFTSTWALIMDQATAAAHPELLAGARVLEPDPGFRAWTDDFSNLLGILK